MMLAQLGAHTDIWVGLIIYFLVILAIGTWSTRHIRGLDDFLLGGRRLGPWVTAISERASGESAWFLMGLPAFAYGTGFIAFWDVIGIAFGIFTSWVLIARPLRVASGRSGALTLPEYFAFRFPTVATPLRWIAGVAVLFFYLFYLGAQINGAGKIFMQVFGWEDAVGGALVGATVVAFYTLLGGFLAVAWTDLIQGLLMAGVAVLLPILALTQLGWSGFIESAEAQREASFFALGNFALDRAVESMGMGAIIGGLAWGLGYLGQPHLLTRYMAIRKVSELRRATMIATGWVLFAYWGVALAGILAVGIVGAQLEDPELVLSHLAQALLPGWLAGIVIAGILAAIMSSADSQLLVATSAVVEDFGLRLLRLRISREGVVVFSRITTLAITALAVLPLLLGRTGIYAIVEYAWTGLGSTFGPPLLLALWWRRTSGVGVLAGMITGISFTLLWRNLPAGLERLAIVDLKIAPFLASLTAVVVGSLLVPARESAEPRSASDRTEG